MQQNHNLLDIINDRKLVKQIAHEFKNSKGSPAEIMARIARDYNFELPEYLAIEIHIASDEVFYFVIPANSNEGITEMEESMLAAGNSGLKLSSLGTVTSLSTVSSISSAVAFFSVSSVGSASCVSSFAGEKAKIEPKSKHGYDINPYN